MSSTYRKIDHNGWNIVIAGIPDEEAFIALCCSHSKESNSAFDEIHCSIYAKVFRFEWAGRHYYFKEYLYRSWWKHRNVLRRGAHLMRIADLMNGAGFRTPPIVCHARKGHAVFTVSQEAKSELKHKDILFSEEVRESIPDMMRFRRLFGREIGRLHAAGFVHGDLRWGNVLINSAGSEQPEFIYLDNDRTQKYTRIPDRLRLKNLVQLRFDIRMVPDPEGEWNEFWTAYLAENPAVAASAERWSREVNRKTVQRIEALKRKPKNRRMQQD